MDNDDALFMVWLGDRNAFLFPWRYTVHNFEIEKLVKISNKVSSSLLEFAHTVWICYCPVFSFTSLFRKTTNQETSENL